MAGSFDSLTQLPRPLGPFTLIRLIAQGGMGQVFLALRPLENEPVDEVCVVKTVRADLREDREAVGRFLDEARVVQKLDHPAICHTLDAGVAERAYYLAMEFISGRNLRDVQTRAQKLNKPLSDSLIFHPLIEVLDALSYAHVLVDKGRPLNIVHRDVSPHNVMVGFNGEVKLIDFGLATHILKRELTRPGIMVGKLRYNAPEQVRDRALDGRSDLYSVGVMLYELVAGERFYEGLSEEEIWRVAMKGNFRPREFNAMASDIKDILDLALAPNPEDRFASAQAMRDAVADCARARNVKDPKRSCSRFMTEIFAEERQEEREMILEATDLAEARTREFSPRSQEKDRSEDPAELSFSVARTMVVSPAQVRGRLLDLVTSFDPNAATQLPLVGSELGELRAIDDISGSDAFANSGSKDDPARPRVSPDINAVTVVSSKRSRSGIPSEPKTAADENLQSSKRASSPEPRLKRDTLLSEPLPPLPPLPTPPAAPRSSKGLWAIVLVALLSMLLLAVVVIPRILAQGQPRIVDSGVALVVDAGETLIMDAGVDALVVDAGQVLVVVDAGEAPVVADAGTAGVVDAGSATEVNDAGREPDKRKIKKVKTEKPPDVELKTLKDQLDYLRSYCSDRVACARSLLQSSKGIVDMSADEMGQFNAEVPKCVLKCKR